MTWTLCARSATPRTFDFEPRDHAELGELLGAIDIARGVKVSGSRFYFLKGIGARLELGLMNMALDRALAEGFMPLITPTLVRPEIMAGTGFLGAHADEVYYLERDDLYLTGTSEVALAGLPRRRDPRPVATVRCGTPAGRPATAARPARRARTTGHHPRAPVQQARDVRLHAARGCRGRARAPARLAGGDAAAPRARYRVIDTAAGDLGSSAARKFDVEAWVPTQDAYRELTSTSNCTTYQARRLDIRYRTESRQDRAGRDAQRHARDDPLDRRDARDAPAGRRFGARARGAAAVPRRPRGHCSDDRLPA